jgi:tRNA(fMet)-specific endonuclease VapC
VRVALDTNRYSDFAKGDAHALDVLDRAERIFVPLIVVAELRAGFACGSRSKENERVFVRFLNTKGVEILYPDEDTTRVYAQLFFQLRQQGTPIPTNDIWIAALAVQHDLILFARDRHFEHLKQLATI